MLIHFAEYDLISRTRLLLGLRRHILGVFSLVAQAKGACDSIMTAGHHLGLASLDWLLSPSIVLDIETTKDQMLNIDRV
jgi:hypothetical protein